MEADNSKTITKHRPPLSRATATIHRGSKNRRREDDEGEEVGDDNDEQCDTQAWETLSKSFRDVQSVLDHNRFLIKQVNDNHRSKLHDGMVQNVALIREINGNISKVMGIYSDLGVNFSDIVQDRRSAVPKNDTSGNSTSTSNS